MVIQKYSRKLLMMDILMSETCWAHKKCCRLKHSCALAYNTDTTPTQPHRNSNTHRTKNNTTNVVIQQNSRKLLMMDTLMSETCRAHKKWNEIASDIKLVFYSSNTGTIQSFNQQLVVWPQQGWPLQYLHDKLPWILDQKTSLHSWQSLSTAHTR